MYVRWKTTHLKDSIFFILLACHFLFLFSACSSLHFSVWRSTFLFLLSRILLLSRTLLLFLSPLSFRLAVFLCFLLILFLTLFHLPFFCFFCACLSPYSLYLTISCSFPFALSLNPFRLSFLSILSACPFPAIFSACPFSFPLTFTAHFSVYSFLLFSVCLSSIFFPQSVVAYFRFPFPAFYVLLSFWVFQLSVFPLFSLIFSFANFNFSFSLFLSILIHFYLYTKYSNSFVICYLLYK